MVWLALLRGINVGGKNTVPMPELKATFEVAGMARVRTYINSGNVVFESGETDRAALTLRLHDAIVDRFGLEVPVLVRSLPELRAALAPLPDAWANNDTMKCDVVFLADDLSAEEVLAALRVRPEIDDVLAVPGAVIWRVDRANATRSGLQKITASPLYRRVTVRNCNTARKLLALMED